MTRSARGRARAPRGTRRRSPRRPDSAVGGLIGRVLLAVLLMGTAGLLAASYLGLLGGGEELAEETASPAVQDLLARSDVAETGAGESRLWRPLRPVPVAERRRAVETRDGDRDAAPAAPLPPPAAVSVPPPATPFRVHVANGCGVNRLAATAREWFQQMGFDVCGVADADTEDYAETLVIDRCGQRERAQAVCALLRERWGVGRVVLQSRCAAGSDVLVVLGSDFAAAVRGR